MLDRLNDPLFREFGSLDALPPAWREVLDTLNGTLAEAEAERQRLARAFDGASAELHELVVELDALRRARTAAESTNLVRGEILATVSRSMRTPADAILGLTGMLTSGALLPTQRAYVDAVQGAAEALRGILNDVSDFSRLENGTLPLEPISFDLRVMVEDLATRLGVQAQAKGLALRLAWRPGTPRWVTGDPGRVRQVLAALVRDGLARIERGEVLLEVSHGTMRVAGSGGGVEFAIEDSGPPIPADLLPTLFEPFTRGDVYPSRDAGLALPISRQLARLMGGELSAINLEDGGTRFTVLLPLPMAPESPPRPIPSAAETESAPGPLVVVDSDPDHRRIWTSIAEAAGYSTMGLGDRRDAVAELERCAAEGRPARIVLFSDHDAQGYDDIGKQILNNERLAHPGLIMLPAVGNPGDARRLREAGFRGYLVKPVAPSDLRETLEVFRRTPWSAWHSLFLTRHSLAESRRGGEVRDQELEASLEQLLNGDTAAPTLD